MAANPVYLMYAVAGFHNDFFMLIPSTAAIAFLLARRDRSAGAMVMVAVAVKFTAILLLPFLLVAARPSQRRKRVIVGAVLASIPLIALDLALFGLSLPNLKDQSTLLTPFSAPNMIGTLLGVGGGTPGLLRLANVALVVTVALRVASPGRVADRCRLVDAGAHREPRLARALVHDLAAPARGAGYEPAAAPRGGDRHAVRRLCVHADHRNASLGRPHQPDGRQCGQSVPRSPEQARAVALGRELWSRRSQGHAVNGVTVSVRIDMRVEVGTPAPASGRTAERTGPPSRRFDRLELAVLLLFGAVSLWVVAVDLWQVVVNGRVWTGTDGVYIVDQMQYLAWISSASHHVLVSNLFVLRSTPADYFQPAVAISGGLAALGIAPTLALLLWKPVAVLGMFFAVRAYVHRSVDRPLAAA